MVAVAYRCRHRHRNVIPAKAGIPLLRAFAVIPSEARDLLWFFPCTSHLAIPKKMSDNADIQVLSGSLAR